MSNGREVTLVNILGEIGRVVRDAPFEVAVYCAVVFVVGAIPEFFAPDQPGWIFLGSIVTLAAGYILLRVLLMRAALVSDGSNRFGSYFVMGIVVGFATVLGFVLLIVPGVILMVRWLPAYAILMAEGGGIGDSLGKSWDMTSGHFVSLLIVLLMAFAVAVPAAVFYALPELGVGMSATIGIVIANLLVAVFNTGLTVAGVGAYGALRESDRDFDAVFA